jgi:hypothetical protein
MEKYRENYKMRESPQNTGAFWEKRAERAFPLASGIAGQANPVRQSLRVFQNPGFETPLHRTKTRRSTKW